MINPINKITILLIGALLTLSPVIVLGSASPKDIIENECSKCHSTVIVYSAKKSEEEWTKTVDRMISYGTKLPENERKTIIHYLSEKK
ncbi:MAG: hypothetical protein RDU01_10380 [Thermodesulfovibrionales bacterium]|nr:hypothetical protein [Thermodesulfovibrionales bacterium]